MVHLQQDKHFFSAVCVLTDSFCWLYEFVCEDTDNGVILKKEKVKSLPTGGRFRGGLRTKLVGLFY
jgi:hypothetical protein